jgi:hypothetical protein
VPLASCVWVTTKANRFATAATDRTISEKTYCHGASDAHGLAGNEKFGERRENQVMFDVRSAGQAG